MKRCAQLVLVLVVGVAVLALIAGITVYFTVLVPHWKLQAEKINSTSVAQGEARPTSLPPGAQQVCHPPCGCFHDAFPFNHFPLPESPAAQSLSWRLYTRQNPELYVVMAISGGKVIVPPEFDPSAPTRILIHGWLDQAAFWDQHNITHLFLQDNAVNVIVVEWQTGARYETYLPAASNTRVVGACTGWLMGVLGTTPDNVHCVGYSLGGQVCGYMGQSMGGKLGRISGLDPADPLFNTSHAEVQLDPTDAQWVDVIHTSVAGMPAPAGHVDFFPNGGGRNPGCADASWGSYICNHRRAVQFFESSIGIDGCKFRSCRCTWMPRPAEDMLYTPGLQFDLCENETSCSDSDAQYMGFYASDRSQRTGTFYVQTTDDSPYC